MTTSSGPIRSWLRARYELVLAVSRRADDHDVDIVAAGLSFYALLGLFPALLALVSIYGLVADPASVQHVLSDLAQTLPQQARALVTQGLADFVLRTSGDLTISIVLGILAVLWSSSSGMGVLVRAINLAYGVQERRSFFGRRLIALSFTLAGVIGVAFVVPAITALPKVLHLLRAETLMVVVPPVVLGTALFLSLLVLFRYAPYRKQPTLAAVVPGAVLASVAWLAVSGAYSLYVRFFARMTSTYGALEGVVVLELWFYFSATVLLYAAELNVELAERRSATHEVGNSGQPRAFVAHEADQHQ
jgi:membrane protein